MEAGTGATISIIISKIRRQAGDPIAFIAVLGSAKGICANQPCYHSQFHPALPCNTEKCSLLLK
jgi:hypothetical protein